MMCEQLGTEPKLEEIPADYADFPYLVQMAITVYSVLPDRWEGFSGTYMGKEYALLPYLIESYEIEDIPRFLQFIYIINNIVMQQRAEEQKRRQKKPTKKAP